MSVKKPSYQLLLDLALEEPDEQSITKGDDSLRREAARQALEGMFGKIGSPRWLDEYFQLREGGWPWRVAAYIAWASSPRAGRRPKTQNQLAQDYLGLSSDRVIATWKKRNPTIIDMIGILQTAPLYKHRTEIYTALTAVAVKPDPKSHRDRKLALELMGDYTPTKKIEANVSQKMSDLLSDLSDQELGELVAASEDKGDDDAASKA